MIIRWLLFRIYDMAEWIWGMEAVMNFHIRMCERVGRHDLANEVRIFWRRQTGEYR